MYRGCGWCNPPPCCRAERAKAAHVARKAEKVCHAPRLFALGPPKLPPAPTPSRNGVPPRKIYFGKNSGPPLPWVLSCAIMRAVMSKVSPEIKTRLMAEGTWKDFSRFRENAQREGNAPAAALRLAVAKFCPDLAGLPPCSHKKGAKSAKELAKHPKRSIVGADGGGEAPSAPVAGVTLDVFEGKTCSMVRAIDWIIDALALDPSQVRPEDAPAAKAWSLYRMCLKSPAFAEDIISKAVVRQIPAGGPEDGGRDGRFDGSGEYDILAAMSGEVPE